MEKQNTATEELNKSEKLDIWDRTDKATAAVGRVLMETDTSNMTTMELIKLTRPVYNEALNKTE